MQAKKTIVTPKGVLKWVYISAPRLNDLSQKEEFSAELHLPKEQAQPLMAEIDQFLKDNRDKAMKGDPKSRGYKVSEETGEVRFTFKTGATYPDGTQKKIRLFDAKAREVDLPKDKRIGNGSVGRISGVLSMYSAPGAWGCSLYLDSVQITKFVEYASASFEADDEGDDTFTGFSDNAFEAL